jgi:hypothetical protein
MSFVKKVEDPVEKFINLYVGILEQINNNYPLEEIRNEVLDVSLKRKDIIYVDNLLSEWLELYVDMADRMKIVMISTLREKEKADKYTVFKRLRFYDICYGNNNACLLFNPLYMIMTEAKDCIFNIETT